MALSQNALVPSILPELVSLRSQSAISAAIDKVRVQRLIESSSLIDRARLLSSSSPHAGDFLICPPLAHLGLKLQPHEWSFAVAYKLGVDVLPYPSICRANGCDAEMDIRGTHAIRCKCQGDRIKRHNDLRNFLFNECKKALVSPVLEPPNLVRNSEMRPADFGIPDYRPGTFMCYDVAVTDPTRQDYLSKSSSVSLHAAEAYSQRKADKYSDALKRDRSLMLTPVIVESFGGWSKSSAEFFFVLSGWLSARNSASSAALIRSRLYQKASLILQRANARMIWSRLFTD
jgi:hypothetical protein